MAYVVRYGRMRFLGHYTGPDDQDHRRGERVVIRSDRGTELGEVLCASTERTSSFLEPTAPGPILRTATADDLELDRSLAAAQQDAFVVCQDFITKRRLQMHLVDVEIILGRERIVFFYLAAKRVDFRELVKDLARALRTRIEMRQIGVRDEAKLLADYGDCGKPVCCNTHLTTMPPVSMKMAKLQKTTLDPAKISGRCGRLKCCLRYEFDTYRSLERELPPVGSLVTTSKGKGRVVAQEILVQKLVIEYEDRRRIIVGRDELLTVEPPRARPADPRQRDTSRSGGTAGPRRRPIREGDVEPSAGAWPDLDALEDAESFLLDEEGRDFDPPEDDRKRG
jgi:cell fate regulator YaaT (PSP1 superfamily)